MGVYNKMIKSVVNTKITVNKIDYIIEKEIDVVANSNIYFIKNLQNKKYVLKETNFLIMNDKMKELSMKEADLLKELKHKYIIRYIDHEIFKSENVHALYIIMDRAKEDIKCFIDR